MVVREVARALGRLELRGRRILVAASGGLDSTALAHVLHELAEEHGLKLSIGHVNHGLRGEEAETDERAVRALARRLALPCVTARVEPRAARRGTSSRDRPTLQEAARALRYEALAGLAREQGADCIATAHHADDQAETVLLRLLRGTGPDGLAGIPEVSPDGRVVRPLLRVTREEIETFARDRRLTWREDASNADPSYARNRLRRDWLPGLARAFNPRLLRAIGDLAEAQRRDSEWIAALTERETAARFERDGKWLRISTKDWHELPEALARRVARAALVRCGVGRHVSRTHLARMLAFLETARPGRAIQLPGGIELARDRRGFRLGPLPSGPGHGVDAAGAC